MPNILFRTIWSILPGNIFKCEVIFGVAWDYGIILATKTLRKSLLSKMYFCTVIVLVVEVWSEKIITFEPLNILRYCAFQRKESGMVK